MPASPRTAVHRTDRIRSHDELVWALIGQDAVDNLIAYDGQTGEIRHRKTIATDGTGFPVRLIAA